MANNATIKVTADTKGAEQKLQKMQQVSGAAGTALSGLGSTFSSFGSQAGAAGGAISNVVGMLATGGVWGVAIGAAIGATSLFIGKLSEMRAATDEVVSSLDRSAKALTDIYDKMYLIGKSKAEAARLSKTAALGEEEAKLQELIDKRDAFLAARKRTFSDSSFVDMVDPRNQVQAIKDATTVVGGGFTKDSLNNQIMLQRITVKAAKQIVEQSGNAVEQQEAHTEELKKQAKLLQKQKAARGKQSAELKTQNSFESKARIAQEQYLRDQKKAEQELNAWVINDEYTEWEKAQEKKRKELKKTHKEYMKLKKEEREKAHEALVEQKTERTQAIIQHTADTASFIAAQTQILMGNEEKAVEKISANIMSFIGQKFFAEGIGLAMKGAGESALGNPGGVGAIAMGLGLAGFGLGSMTSAPFIAGNNQNMVDRLNSKKEKRSRDRSSVDAPVGRLSTGSSEPRGATTTVVYNFNAPVYNEDEAARAVWRMNNRGGELEQGWR